MNITIEVLLKLNLSLVEIRKGCVLEFNFEVSAVLRPSLPDEVTAVSSPVPCALFALPSHAPRVLLRNNNLYHLIASEHGPCPCVGQLDREESAHGAARVAK